MVQSDAPDRTHVSDVTNAAKQHLSVNKSLYVMLAGGVFKEVELRGRMGREKGVLFKLALTAANYVDHFQLISHDVSSSCSSSSSTDLA